MGHREVVVSGSTVRRPRKPWTETVHALLAHLRSFDLPVPQPLALDQRFEYVSLVEGLAGDEAWQGHLTADAARSMGQLIRRVHDATRTWNPPQDAVWSVPHASTITVCHGDPKPGNFAWENGRVVGLFDWDAARPANPESDVAYALLWTVPVAIRPLPALSPSAKRDARARADALLEGYGWEGSSDVVGRAVERHEQAIDEVEWLGLHGHEPHVSWVRDGWAERWRRDLAATWP